MEICGKIKHVVRHIHLIGYTSSILNIVQGTAGLFPVDTDIFVVVSFMVAPMHSSPDSFVKRAATELSTPPLIAMIAFFIYILTFPDD
mgnify:FL=1